MKSSGKQEMGDNCVCRVVLVLTWDVLGWLVGRVALGVFFGLLLLLLMLRRPFHPHNLFSSSWIPLLPLFTFSVLFSLRF